MITVALAHREQAFIPVRKCTTQFKCQKKNTPKNTERCHLLSTAVVLFISLLITENILPRAQSFHILSRRAHLMYSHFEAVKCTSNERICAHLPTVLTKHKRRRFPANVQNFQEYVCISQCVCVWVIYKKMRDFYTWTICNETFHMHFHKKEKKMHREIVSKRVLTICHFAAIQECSRSM